MPLEKPQVEQIARLAGLDLTPEETVKISGQLSLIVDFFDQLVGDDSSALTSERQFSQAVTILGQDKVRPSLSRRQVLILSNESDGEQFLVPKVLR